MGVQHLKFHILGKPSALWKLGCFTHILHPLPCLCSLGLLPSSVPSYHALKTSQDCPHPTLPSCHHGHDFAEVSCRWRALFLHSITEGLPMGRAGRRGTLWAPWKLSLGQEEWWLLSLAAGAESQMCSRGATMSLPRLLAGTVDSHSSAWSLTRGTLLGHSGHSRWGWPHNWKSPWKVKMWGPSWGSQAFLFIGSLSQCLIGAF